MARGQGGQPSDKSNGEMIGAGALVLVAFILATIWWHAKRPAIARAAVHVAAAEATTLWHVRAVFPTGYRDGLRDRILRWELRLCDPITPEPGMKPGLTLNGHEFFCRKSLAPFQNVNGADIREALSYPSKALLPIVILLFGFMGWHIQSVDVLRRYKRKFDLDDFIRMMAKQYPRLKPIVDEHIDEMPLHEGPWAAKITHILFATRHELLREADGTIYTEQTYRAHSIDVEKATAVFVSQLGQPWKKVWSNLPPYEQAIYGICAAMIARQRSKAMRAVDDICNSWTKTPKNRNALKRGPLKRLMMLVSKKARSDYEKLKRTIEYVYSVNPNPGIALAREFGSNPEVVEVTRKHAFVHTMLASMLKQGRLNAGEAAESAYLWLKPINRTFFYVLHQVGQGEADIEAGGAFAHLGAEIRAGTPIPTPQVGPAVDALEWSLRNEGWLIQNSARWTDKSKGKKIAIQGPPPKSSVEMDAASRGVISAAA